MSELEDYTHPKDEDVDISDNIKRAAKIARGIYQGYQNAGFTKEQALEITKLYIAAAMVPKS